MKNLKKVKAKYESGISGPELAKMYDVAPISIYRWLSKVGANIKRPYAANKIILSDSQKREVMKLYEQGLGRKLIAHKLGLTEHSVRMVLCGNTRSPKETACILATKRAHTLNDHQYQCILGSLLGDASLLYRRNTYELTMNHCEDQREYIEHKHNLICSAVNARGTKPKLGRYRKTSGFAEGSFYYRFAYGNKATLSEIAKLVLVNNQKTVNRKWLDRITVEGIAYWFMDDGSSSYYGKNGKSFARFATNDFQYCEVELLKSKLIALGFKSTIGHSNNGGFGYYLRLNNQSAQMLYKAIKPFVVPSMRYKIKLT